VYLVFNSLVAVLSPGSPDRLLPQCRAGALEPGGVFVIECFAPDKAPSGQDQRITTQIVTLDEHGMRLRPVTLRYAWPANWTS
jgi:hypothetical protein